MEAVNREGRAEGGRAAAPGRAERQAASRWVPLLTGVLSLPLPLPLLAAHHQVIYLLGTPVKAHGEMTSRGKARHVKSAEPTIQGVKHTQVCCATHADARAAALPLRARCRLRAGCIYGVDRGFY